MYVVYIIPMLPIIYNKSRGMYGYTLLSAFLEYFRFFHFDFCCYFCQPFILYKCMLLNEPILVKPVLEGVYSLANYIAVYDET